MHLLYQVRRPLVKLMDYRLKKEGYNVCSISMLGLPDPILLHDANLRGDTIFDDYWKQETRRLLGEERTWHQWLNDDKKKSYIIIDEAQILYSRAKLFWETIKKLAQERNVSSPRVILFAAYGEGSSWSHLDTD